ncbi:ribonucleoprotein PTB-binding 1 isoform X1 [Pimephales promelas]|uniref:ribonucleoprotein PTB-binding 1 isoform X1 n=1 Tax=Pimephales promelas TaxID=90988 RepID=UPI00195581EC|nr:ribonucleoprotein PTB-binding 1 isoform X1 [Pimephales promelas]KAG1968860.1 ribonucleoprotein PTB-binding [Pimephales promelas]
MAAVSSAAKDEKSFTGANFAPNPLYTGYDQTGEHENWEYETGKQVESDAVDEGSQAGSDCSRRLDDELTALSPEEIASRLERTRREFYNRRKIIIKNLPVDISNQEVHELLSNYDLKYCFVDKYKGTAFVTLLNGEQAQFAIKEFHQYVLRDREISVQLQPTDALLCIANLPRAFTQQQFEELVRPFGNIERCFLVHSSATGHSKAYGFVEYMKKDSAARAKSELLGKQLGSRMLYVHWTEVGSLTYPMLQSRCLCVDRLPQNILTAQDLRSVLIDTHVPIFCQIAQGQDCSFRRFAVLEFSTPEMAEDVQRLTDGRSLGGTRIRVSFCAPGPPGRSMLAALIAAQTMALNRGKGLLPEPNAIQILTGLNNPATLKMMMASLNPGHKQGLLGAAPAVPLLANPALSAALMQMLLQNQVQQAGLLSENPLAALPLQQGINMLGEMSQGAIAPTLGLQNEPLGPIKQPSLSRPLGRETETPATPIGFPPASSPALQGLSMSLLAGMLGADGPTLPGASILGEPPKEVGVSQNPFLSAPSIFPSSGASNRAHPYRKKTAIGSASNQRTNHSIHSNYSLRFQESCTPEFPLLHQDPLSHLYEQQEVLENAAIPGYGLQLSRHAGFGDAGSPFSYPPSSPQSYFSFGAHTGIPSTQLNKAVGMPPVTHSSLFPAAPGAGMKTPIGGQKRLFSRLIPSPEPSPEGGYVGQHSQGLGGHYADSYLKRKRIF